MRLPSPCGRGLGPRLRGNTTDSAAPNALESDEGVVLKHRNLQPLNPSSPSSAPPRRSVEYETFAGRWLLITGNGDCLLDELVDDCPLERQVPLGTLCSLAAAVLQFQASAWESGTPTSLQSIDLGNLLIAACSSNDFSVVVLREHGGMAGGQYASLCGSLQQKAEEVHRTIRTKLGDTLKTVLEKAAESCEGKMESYTAASVAGGCCESAGLLDSSLAAAAQRVLRLALSQTFPAVLQEAALSVTPDERAQLKCMCLFGHRGELVAKVAGTDRCLDWRGAELSCLAARSDAASFTKLELVCQQDDARVWCWPQDYHECLVAIFTHPSCTLRLAIEWQPSGGRFLPPSIVTCAKMVWQRLLTIPSDVQADEAQCKGKEELARAAANRFCSRVAASVVARVVAPQRGASPEKADTGGTG